MSPEHKVGGIEDFIAEDIRNANIWATKDSHPFEVKVDEDKRFVEVLIWRGERQPGQNPWMLLHFEKERMRGHLELTYAVNVIKEKEGYGYLVHTTRSPIEPDLSKNALKLHEVHEIKTCEEAMERIRPIVDKHFFKFF